MYFPLPVNLPHSPFITLTAGAIQTTRIPAGKDFLAALETEGFIMVETEDGPIPKDIGIGLASVALLESDNYTPKTPIILSIPDFCGPMTIPAAFHEQAVRIEVVQGTLRYAFYANPQIDQLMVR